VLQVAGLPDDMQMNETSIMIAIDVTVHIFSMQSPHPWILSLAAGANGLVTLSLSAGRLMGTSEDHLRVWD